MKGIGNEELRVQEKNLLSANLKKEHFGIFLWPKASKDIPDTRELKLIVQENQFRERCQEFLENYGERPRVYCNTLLFLCPMDSERKSFEDFLKKKLAWQLIEKDKTLRLTEAQKKEVKENIKTAETDSKENIRDLYRIVFVPAKDGLKEIDLGRLTYGTDISIDKEIYDRLRNEGEVLPRLEPLTIKEKYLKDKDFVETKNILESFFKTPGEIRIVSDEVLKDSIKEGVRQGLFGTGGIEAEKPMCRHFKADFSPALVDGEILIRAELCKSKKIISDEETKSYLKKIQESQTIESLNKVIKEVSSYELSPEQKEKIEDEVKRKRDKLEGSVVPPPKEKYQNISLKLAVPSGKLSDIVRMVTYLKSRFNQVDIKIEISTQNGEIAISDYEDKIKEALSQANVHVEEEDVK